MALPIPSLDPTGVGYDAPGVVDFDWVPDDLEPEPEPEAHPDAGPDAGPDAAPDFAERLVRRFLLLCESPRTQQRTVALVRSAARGGRSGRAFQTLVNRAVLNPLSRAMGIRTSAMRLELIASQLLGVATTRYVLKFEPVASATIDQLVPLIAPGVRAVLEADVPSRVSQDAL